MNIYHPSIERYKKYRPIGIPARACISPDEGCFNSGALILSRKIDTNIRLYNAQNSAVASRDVRIYNVYHDNGNYNSTNDNFNALSDNIALPPIWQGQNGCCQLMPFMHQIQNSLNFPVDIGSLIACLETSPPPNVPPELGTIVNDLTTVMEASPNYGDGVAQFYGKLTNLLFSGECIPIREAPPNIDKCGSNGLPMGNKDLREDQDCACPTPKAGIKITAKKITTPSNPEDLFSDFKKNGPRGISLKSKDLGKLWLHHNNHNDWNDLKNLFQSDIYDRIRSLGGDPDQIMFGTGHIVTLTNVTKNSDGTYTIELTNSWGKTRNTINIDYSGINDLILGSNDPVSDYIIEIEECSSGDGSGCDEDNNEEACKSLGYDGIDETKEGCPCICEEGRYYSASQHRCICRKGPDTYPCSGLSTLGLGSLEINSKIYNVVPVSEIKVI